MIQTRWPRARAVARVVSFAFALVACDQRGAEKSEPGTAASTLAPLAPVVPSAASPKVSVDAGASAAVVLEAAHVIDGVANAPRDGLAVLVEGGRIREIGPRAAVEAKAGSGVRRVDLGDATLLPGLIDAHTHVLLQGDVTSADYDEQILKDSVAYRTIRATVAARTALMNGFTTLRDLGTEGAGYADVDLKRAIDRGIVPGPRLFVSGRAISATGTYPVSGYSWELKVPDGVHVADGPDGVRKAVREEAKYGADWIKYYSDRKYFLGPAPGCPHALCSLVNFTDDEAHAIVDEAHRLGKKVAAHAVGWNGIDSALRAGVDSIEHGDGLEDDLLDRMARQRVAWCPTIYVGIFVAPGRGGPWPRMVELEKAAFAKALKRDVIIAYGTDAGGYDWSENQAKELAIMVGYGMSPMAAIKSATSIAASLLDQKTELGTLEAGKVADIIAVARDPIADVRELQRVTFVMKGGTVVKGPGSSEVP